jgi:hypothetical protein
VNRAFRCIVHRHFEIMIMRELKQLNSGIKLQLILQPSRLIDNLLSSRPLFAFYFETTEPYILLLGLDRMAKCCCMRC